MRRIKKKTRRQGQTAIEYMLLLGMVVVVFFLFFEQFAERINNASEFYFNEVANGMMGDKPNAQFLDRNNK